MGRLSADEVFRLTESLVSLRSISPDVPAETACARAILDALPDGVERGSWAAPDGRPIVWARVTGKPGPAVLLLSHYDTVGVSEFAERDAFDPAALREAFLREAPTDERLSRDLAEERERPGTWMFGRGTLDMKSGVAAGIAALHALSDDPPAVGDVVFVATPDEEHASTGILGALPELARLKGVDGVRFEGALNLDFGEGPVAYAGVEGKLLLGVLAVGATTHAGAPLEGTDAIAIASSVVAAMTQQPDSVGVHGHIPVALQLRDLKMHYDVQTAGEANALVHVPLPGVSAESAFESMRALARQGVASLRERLAAQRVQAMQMGSRRAGASPPEIAVLSYADLAGVRPTRDAADEDPQALALSLARSVAKASDVPPPFVLLYACPPFYPSAPCNAGAFPTAVRGVLEDAGQDVRMFYPFVSDACYMRWEESTPWLERHLAGFGRTYRLPVDAMRTLDMDVINLGPWGHDAHGLHERVNVPYAFETLPRLIEACVRRTLSSA